MFTQKILIVESTAIWSLLRLTGEQQAVTSFWYPSYFTPSSLASSFIHELIAFNLATKLSSSIGSETRNRVASLATFFFPKSSKSDCSFHVYPIAFYPHFFQEPSFFLMLSAPISEATTIPKAPIVTIPSPETGLILLWYQAHT